jgi:hypothetical protein
VADGAKFIERVHSAPAARLAPQVDFSAKPVAFAPPIAIPLIVNAAVPVLLSVIVCGVVVDPAASVKFSEEVLTVNLGAVPVPVNAMTWGVADAEVVKDSAPLRAPVAVGVKVTVKVQEALTRSALPQDVA